MIKQMRQVGRKLSSGKKIGVPAQTIVSMLIEIVLKRTAESSHLYLHLNQFTYVLNALPEI